MLDVFEGCLLAPSLLSITVYWIIGIIMMDEVEFTICCTTFDFPQTILYLLNSTGSNGIYVVEPELILTLNHFEMFSRREFTLYLLLYK